jgi:hypothetical protein
MLIMWKRDVIFVTLMIEYFEKRSVKMFGTSEHQSPEWITAISCGTNENYRSFHITLQFGSWRKTGK